MNHPTKRGITIINRMLKVDRPAEENAAWHKQPLPCTLVWGEGVVTKYLRDHAGIHGPQSKEFQKAVNRGARVPDELMGT